MKKILFTGGGGAGNEALWRLLGQKYSLYFGDADLNAINPDIPADRHFRLPWASDPNYVAKMVDLCGRLNIDILVPGVDEELLPLARNTMEFGATRLLLPHAEYVETMLDKLQMIRALSDKEIPVPYSCALNEDLKKIHFPCICKPRSGRGSRDVYVLDSLADAISLASTKGEMAEKTLVQDKVGGVEYTVQMLADADGRLRAIVPVRVGIKRGITLRAETELEPLVINACEHIHTAIPTGGCYNIQLMLTADGKALPFEINPRVSTTLCLSVAAGIDPISIFLGDCTTEGMVPFTAGVTLQRHWVNQFSGIS